MGDSDESMDLVQSFSGSPTDRRKSADRHEMSTHSLRT